MTELLEAIGGGMWVTVQISILVAIGSLLLGVIVTAMRMCPVGALRWVATGYVVAFRSVPLAVVCFIVAFGLPTVGWNADFLASSGLDLIFPSLGSDLPYVRLFVMAFVLYTGAFVSDAICAGIDTVPRSHTEQAGALGAGSGQRALYVVLPHTWKPIVVSVGRVIVTMIKNSALAASFGVIGDLSQATDQLAGTYAGSIITVLVGVAIAYLVMTMPLTMLLDRVERGFAATAVGAEAHFAAKARQAPRRPGGRAHLAVNAAVIAVTVGLAYVWIYQPMARAGQFSARLWAPITDTADPNFAMFWSRIGAGIQATLTAAALAIIASLLCGTALAVLQVLLEERRVRRPGWRVTALAARGLETAAKLGVNLLRGLPVVITILVASRGLPALGIPLDDPLWYLVVGLTLHNMVVVAEIIRTGMRELPLSYREAAYLMGARPLQTARTILLPQAFRIVLPTLSSRLVVVLTDTSLGFIVGYEELLAVARQANSDLQAPIQIYLVVALIYLTLNAALAALVQHTRIRSVKPARATRTMESPRIIASHRAQVYGTAGC